MPGATEGPTAPSLPRASAQPPFGVFLGPKAYALAHAWLWLFRAACVVYFVAAGVLYRALATTKLVGMLQLYSLTIPRAYYRAISITHYVVAALYARYLIASLLSLLPTRLRGSHSVSTRGLSAFAGIHPELPSDHAATRRLSARAMATLNRSRMWRVSAYAYRLLLAPHGILGVESTYFELFFAVREIVETILQTNQAYQMSRLLPRARLNRGFVTLLALNCWSTPFMFTFGGNHTARRRLLSLMCDVLLDFISAVGLPVWLALDYIAEFDVEAEDFPMSSWYSDVWVVRFMNDVPLLLLGTWIGAFSRLLFSLSLLNTLDDIQALIKRQRATVEPIASASAAPTAKPTKASGSERRHARFVSWSHVVMVIYGCVIVAVQLYAETRPFADACLLVVRPWLVSKPACALIEINCLTSPTLSGNSSDFNAITGHIDDLSLEHIVFRHCPRVEITSRLQDFHSLVGFKLYNSTLESWGAEAALTQSRHPNIRFLFLVHTRFPKSELPPGLISREFPSALRDIEISGSNLILLPDDLHERWPQALTLYVEFGLLTEFPSGLYKLSPRMLVLGGNPIKHLPPEAMLLPDAYLVAFTRSQLEAFPDSGVDPRAVYTTSFFAEASNVAALPAWMDESFLQHTSLYLGGTPFCVQLLNESSAERMQLLAERPYLETYVDCNVLDPILYPFYPQYLDVRADEQALLGGGPQEPYI